MSHFRGGIHPPGSKELTRGKRIEDAPIPEHLSVPMVQHLGGPAKPKVAKGDEIRKGQLVGEASGFVSANVHSPVSGKVSGIEERPIYQGIEAPCVLIENDGREEWADGPRRLTSEGTLRGRRPRPYRPGGKVRRTAK